MIWERLLALPVYPLVAYTWSQAALGSASCEVAILFEDAVATDVQVLVRVVPTGVEALAFTASIRPSLIVVHSAGFDDNLADLIRALKSSESTRRVPVVVIGAAAARAAAIQAGCDDYVETPFGSADLAPVLRGRL